MGSRIGFAARLAGHWSNGHFVAVVLHLGWTNKAVINESLSETRTFSLKKPNRI